MKTAFIFSVIFLAFAGLASANSERDLRVFVAEQERLQTFPVSGEEKASLLIELEKLSLQAGAFIDSSRKEARRHQEADYQKKESRLNQRYNLARKNRLERLNSWFKKHPDKKEEYAQRRKNLLSSLTIWFSDRREFLRTTFITEREALLFRFERRWEEMIRLTEKGEMFIRERPEI